MLRLGLPDASLALFLRETRISWLNVVHVADVLFSPEIVPVRLSSNERLTDLSRGYYVRTNGGEDLLILLQHITIGETEETVVSYIYM